MYWQGVGLQRWNLGWKCSRALIQMESLRQKGIGSPRRISMTLAAPQHPPDRDQTQLWGRIYSVLPVTCCVESELGLNKWVIPRSESSYANQKHQLTRPRQTRILILSLKSGKGVGQRSRSAAERDSSRKDLLDINVRGTAKTDTSYHLSTFQSEPHRSYAGWKSIWYIPWQ